jgi:protein TonB
MSEQTNQQPAAEAAGTANEQFKKSFSSWFWGSMITATVLHFAAFAFWPDMAARDVSVDSSELEAIELPPEVEIPPPPAPIQRPATPVIATAEINEDITIAEVTFEANPVENLPPPPEDVETDISSAPVFTPYTVAPDYTNGDEVRRALEREYPPLLRDAGIGGTVQVWFFIDEKGIVQNRVVNESSGHTALDDAALRVAPVFKFTPALNRDKAVPVWVSLPITFTTR